MKDLPEPPKATGADTLHAVLRAGISALGGGPALELLARWFGPPLERRRDAWAQDLITVIADFEKRGVDVAALKDSDDFCDLVLNATAAAMRTHHEKKRHALRNAITNAGLSGTAGETKTRTFLRLIDELEVHHVLLLELMADPAAFLRARGLPLPAPPRDQRIEMDAVAQIDSERSLNSIVQSVLSNDLPADLRALVYEDLKRRGLVAARATFSTICTGSNSLASALGHEFLRFIREPAPVEN